MSLPPLIQRVTADTSQFEGSMGRLPSIAKAAGVAIGAAVVAAATAMVALTRASLANVDALTKQARSLGLTTSAFQAMTLVASEAGVSSDKLAASLGLMQRQIVELSQGSQVAVEAFKALGLSIEDLQGLEPDEQFRRIAERLIEIEDPAIRTATAMEVFGRSGRAAINMLEDYGTKIDDATAFQERFGIAVAQTDAEAIERANDAVGRLREAFGGLGNVLAARFAPLIERASRGLLAMAGTIADKLGPGTDALALSIIEANRQFPTMESGLNRISSAASSAAGNLSAAQIATRAFVDEIVRARELGVAGQMELMGVEGTAPVRLPGFFPDPLTPPGGLGDLPIPEFLDNPDGFSVSIPAPSPLAPMRSPIPQRPGVDDFPDIAVPSIGAGSAVEDQMAGRLESIIESLATEDEVIAEWYESSRETLAEALASKELTEEEYRELRERLEKEHQDRMAGIRDAGESRGLTSAKGFFDGMAAIAQAGGQKTVKIAAAIGAVQGLIDAYGAALKALNSPEPLTIGQRFAAYAGVLAAGLKGVMSIQQAGRSGSAAGAGGAASGATASAAPAMARQNIVIDLVGDTFSGDSVRALFSQINDGLRSGYQIEGVLAR